ncbi:hypothetical protein [Pedobacter gandavensis]|uniref:Uncharacterized protein n=1 Tax=Pedobacter gandavensis TaxID=2679963 RepID=A0ABR6EYI8_9SPHI|nr:hypothetical protein [Pedobacter gandavensis]MBB2150353.1 hypothetical protein [Pedobacter gandavensis]
MNYITIGALILITLIALPYLFSSFKKLNKYNMPFLKAFNPACNLERYEAEVLRKSFSPITLEMETKQIAGFINHWTAKFENKQLNSADVVLLNEQLAVGNTQQVNGILALHPDALNQYNEINKALTAIENEKIAAQTQASVEAATAETGKSNSVY